MDAPTTECERYAMTLQDKPTQKTTPQSNTPQNNTPSKNLFRQEASDRLTSPEQLDQLVEVVDLRAWIPLATMAGLAIAALLWGIFGRLPINVTGQGVLLRPRRVLQVQTPSAGRIVNLTLQPGQEVRKGEILGILDQSATQQELQQEQEKLKQLQSQTGATGEAQKRQLALQRQNLQQQQTILQTQLQEGQAMAPVLRDKGILAVEKNRKGLELRLSQMRDQLPILKERVNIRRQLQQMGGVSSDTVLQAEQEYNEKIGQIADLETQLQQLDVKELETQQQYLQNQGSIKETQNKLQEIVTQEAKLVEQELQQTFDKTNQINEVKRKIAQLELQLSTQGKIISPYDGRVLEVAAMNGQVIEAGGRLGAIQAEDPAEQLVSLTFFPDKDGKQIQAGMMSQVSPSISKRERFGGIVGKVIEVSPYPVSSQSITALVGNAELAKQLAGESAPVQVMIQLQPDRNTFSGYQWTSSNGPNQTLTSGTTATVQVRVGEIAPIAYIIPLFRSWTGVY